MIEFLTEETIRELFLPATETTETLLSVGKAINYRWTTSYYVGYTDQNTILARHPFLQGLKTLEILPNDAAIDYLKKRKIKTYPFEHPFILKKKGMAIYQELQETVLELMENDEELITFARAEDNKHLFRDYCVVFTNNRFLIVRIERKDYRVRDVESILLGEIRESALSNSLYKQVKMETPFEGNNSLMLTIKHADDNKIGFRILDIYGSPAGLTGG